MRERFRPFPRLNCRYGAPMGRCDTRTDWEGVPLEKLCAAGPAYEYDAGGAYWGRGEGPVGAVWERGKGREGVAYVRAWSAENAKRAVMPENEENAG